jgi:hypothetical protein
MVVVADNKDLFWIAEVTDADDKKVGSFWAFVAYLPHWEHNANIHISLLYKFLWQSITNTSNLPAVLYLQLDNYAKDNKN